MRPRTSLEIAVVIWMLMLASRVVHEDWLKRLLLALGLLLLGTQILGFYLYRRHIKRGGAP